MDDQEKQQEPEQEQAPIAEQGTAPAPVEAEAQEPVAAEPAPEPEAAASPEPEAANEPEPATADSSAPETADEPESAPVAAAGSEPEAAGAAEDDTAAAPESQNFEQALAEFEASGAGEPKRAPAVGEKVSGRILSIGEESAIVDLGIKSEATIDTSQLKDGEGNLVVKEGDTLEATVASVDPETGTLKLKRRAGGGRAAAQEVPAALRQAQQDGLPVEGQVTGINKGGAEVQVFGMRAFCPLSQLDVRYVENPQQFIGQRLTFRVARIEEGKKGRRPDIVLSRRALLEEEAQTKAASLRENLKVGATVTGRITSITTYGAFLDLGGLEGLLHVSEIGFSRLTDPKDVLQVGQDLEVQIIKIETGKDDKRQERISLSRKALEKDPWSDAADLYPEGTQTTGRVVRLETFGAFVELTPGLEGLVHISELGAGRRVNHPREVVDVGQEVNVRVLGVDKARRRISLSMGSGEGGSSSSSGARDYGGDRERGNRGGGGGGGGRGGGGGGRGDRGGDRDRGDRGDRGDRDRGDRDIASISQPSGSFGAMADFFKNSERKR